MSKIRDIEKIADVLFAWGLLIAGLVAVAMSESEFGVLAGWILLVMILLVAGWLLRAAFYTIGIVLNWIFANRSRR